MPEIKHFPFSKLDDRPQMGVKPLDLKGWIEIDENWAKHIQMKSEIIRNHRKTVLQSINGSDEGCLELRDVLAEHLSSQFPDKFALQHGNLKTPAGVTFAKPKNGEEALEQISQMTQEDWGILSPKAPVKLDAGIICFPSRWNLAEKIGLESSGIHAPVPKYETIAKPTQSFLERVSVDKPMVRMNWTIHDSDKLFTPGPHPAVEGLTAEDVLSRTYLRVERQTLRRLPKTGYVVFSIRTFINRMDEVVADPARKQQARESLNILSPETAAYRGMRNFHHLLKTAIAE